MSESFTPNNTAGFRWLVRGSRSRAINEWLFQSGLSPSLAAVRLCEKAVSEGLVQRKTAPKGTTLQDWIEKNSAPMWACKAAFLLCLESGWKPKDASSWAMYGYFFIRVNSDCQKLNDYSDRISEDLDKLCALGWICAALEESQKSYKYISA
ncbi:hypothetical protein FZI27_20340 [Cronobacter sakazakii]|nr:hypothetical protein FZI27_20340 [Cronobacter sakazakii]